MRVTPGDLDLC